MIPSLRLVLPGRVTTSETGAGGDGGDPFVLPQPGSRPAIGNGLPGGAGPVGAPAGQVEISRDSTIEVSATSLGSPVPTPGSPGVAFAVVADRPTVRASVDAKPATKATACHRPPPSTIPAWAGHAEDMVASEGEPEGTLAEDDPAFATPPTEQTPPALFGAATALLLGKTEVGRDPRVVPPGGEPSSSRVIRSQPSADQTTPAAPARVATGPLPLDGGAADPKAAAAPAGLAYPLAAGTLHPLDAAKLGALPARPQRPEAIAAPNDVLVAAQPSSGPPPAPVAPVAPTDPMRAAPPHPLDTHKPSRGESEIASTQRPGAVASPSPLAEAVSRTDTRHSAPADPPPATVGIPMPSTDARTGGGSTGDSPPPPSAPDRHAATPLIERVEFDTGLDGVTRLRLVHESVGRLLVTLGAGERTDVRMTTDDAAVRQTLADALPTLRRLADDRHLPLGAVEVAAASVGGDARGRDAPADRRPAPPTAHAPPPHAPAHAARPLPRSTPAGRSAGLFA